jgi:phenylacetate-CoA ligase
VIARPSSGDVARCLPDEALSCELASVPATSQILGKADHLLRLGTAGVITPRQLIDAIEALPTAPWPARYRATVHGGRIQLTLPAAAIADYGDAAASRHFAEAGLDVDLTIVSDDRAASLRHTRSDLLENTFATEHALVGA